MLHKNLDCSICKELRQRFFKFETLHACHMIPLSLLGMYVTVYHLEYVLHVIAAQIFTFTLVEGLRYLFYNPVKKEALKVLEREKYIANHFPNGHYHK